ncbi:MAG: 2-oxoacid:acceptor oxidoreductase subunit alpha [Candidatus Eisenbacteria bacterium]|nr:2-oxoacid:acceptor oxidoreductase subunit alpha [Candidatus Eisenbacteria bacterium]
MSRNKFETSTDPSADQPPDAAPPDSATEDSPAAGRGATETPDRTPATQERKRLDHVVIRFAGDSGDGMQLTGNQFTRTSALLGNDVATLPDYPAEIRAPAGTLPGVSAFQLNFSSLDIHTPGDRPDVLVAMNPAALKVNVDDLEPGKIIIVNTGTFTDRELKKAGYESNPLEDGSLDRFRVIEVDITRLTREVLDDVDMSTRLKDRCKNFYALGLMYWLFNRPMKPTEEWIEQRFGKTPALKEANLKALKGGYAYGAATEMFQTIYDVPPTVLPPGTYRHISGNAATALGLVVAARKAGLPLFYGSYPITPASEILHELSRYKAFDVLTFQAEDEIAAISAAVGSAYGGAIGVTATSGPGLDLKEEAIGLAYMVELPVVIVNVQRGGPSTGLPTKTEQSDLLAALFGRHGDASLPVLAASTPPDLFHMCYEAVRIATRYMTPVILLSDGYLANGAEPWRVPDLADLAPIDVRFRTDPEGFQPYARDEKTLSRPWAVPGSRGLEHRIGGLEKQHLTGDVSYDPDNHEKMVNLRAEKVDRIAKDIPAATIHGAQEGDLLVLSWGSSYGPVQGAVHRMVNQGHQVGHVNLRYLNPFPDNLGEVLRRFKRILIPELNRGQLRMLIRDRFLIDARGYNKIQGQPFRESEILQAIHEQLEAVRS